MKETQHTTAPTPEREEPPPFGRSWNFLYAIVIVNLALLILLFYAFTKAFS